MSADLVDHRITDDFRERSPPFAERIVKSHARIPNLAIGPQLIFLGFRGAFRPNDASLYLAFFVLRFPPRRRSFGPRRDRQLAGIASGAGRGARMGRKRGGKMGFARAWIKT